MVVMVLMVVTSSRFTDVRHSAAVKCRVHRQCDGNFDALTLIQHAETKSWYSSRRLHGVTKTEHLSP
jgi:hypothetical protein